MSQGLWAVALSGLAGWWGGVLAVRRHWSIPRLDQLGLLEVGRRVVISRQMSRYTKSCIAIVVNNERFRFRRNPIRMQIARWMRVRR